jgi:hypothetical protein
VLAAVLEGADRDLQHVEEPVVVCTLGPPPVEHVRVVHVVQHPQKTEEQLAALVRCELHTQRHPALALTRPDVGGWIVQLAVGLQLVVTFHAKNSR